MLIALLTLALVPQQSPDFEVRHRALSPLRANTLTGEFIDVDGDGDVDLFEGNSVSDRLHRNEGAVFALDRAALSTPSAATNGVVFADLTGNGAPDLVAAMGQISDIPSLSVYPNALFTNDGTGVFTEQPSAFTGLFRSMSVFGGDLDMDGDVDVVFGNDGAQNTLWLNDGSGGFVQSPNRLPLANDRTWDVVGFDVESDGDLDLVFVNNLELSRLARNDGLGNFTLDAAALPPTSAALNAGAVGDVDGNGADDLIVSSAVWLNSGTGVFTELPGALPYDTGLGLHVADVDRDGTLDLLSSCCGFSKGLGGGFFANTAPTWPNPYYQFQPFVRDVAAADVDGDGDLDVLAAGGGEPIPSFGVSRPLWSALYLQGAPGVFTDANTIAESLPPVQKASTAVAAGDLDADGDLDVISAGSVTGPSFTTFADATLLLNEGFGRFSDASASLPFHEGRLTAIRLGDVDGDNDLDAVVGGVGPNNLGPFLYRNDGAANFTFGLMPYAPDARDLELGDLDADGDLDVVLALNSSVDAAYPTQLQTNSGAGTFTADTTQFDDFLHRTEDVALGDLDGDGDLDVVMGNHTGFGPVLPDVQDRVYLNQGNATFVLNPAVFAGEAYSTRSLALGDLDQDGFLDLWANYDNLGAGGGTEFSQLRINDGLGDFASSASVLPDSLIWHEELTIVDIDLDGQLDLVGAGSPSYLRNLGGGLFESRTGDLGETVPGTRALAVGDFDGDLDPDLYFARDGIVSLGPGSGSGGQGLDEILWNRKRNLSWKRAPAIGKTLRLKFCAEPGDVAFLYRSRGTATIPLAIGTVRLDPATLLFVDSLPAGASGCATFALPVPVDLTLVGVELYAQALVATSPIAASWLTNLEPLPITDL